LDTHKRTCIIAHIDLGGKMELSIVDRQYSIKANI
jgi:hypothetical protein